MPAFMVSWEENHKVTAVIIAPNAAVAIGVVMNEEVETDSDSSTLLVETFKAEPMSDTELRRRLVNR